MKRFYLVLVFLFSILLLDQSLKIYIKTNFYYGQSVKILNQDWARLRFIENEGMAFGITLGDKCLGVKTENGCKGLNITPRSGKLILTSFRLIMIVFLIYLLRQIARDQEPLGLIIAFTMILAGAIGNIIDSVFYGKIFSHSNYHTRNIAELFPEGGGYDDLMHGKVVDMFYLPMIDSTFPNWLPIVGGKDFIFFSPIFNVADASISVGIFILIVFYHRFFVSGRKKE